MTLLLLAALVLADIPPPDSEGCRKAKAGAKCLTDAKKPGTCVKSTCTQADYSDGPPPKYVAVDCLLCSAGAPDAGVKK